MIDPRPILTALCLAFRLCASDAQADDAWLRATQVEVAAWDVGVPAPLAHGIVVAESGYRLRGATALTGCRPYVDDDWRQAHCAATSLRTGLRVCGSVPRALVRYKTGRCDLPAVRRVRYRWHRRWRIRIDRRERQSAERYVRLVMRVAAVVRSAH